MIYSQVAQLEAALATELKERSSLLQTLHEMQQKMSEPKDPCSSDKESAVHIQVMTYYVRGIIISKLLLLFVYVERCYIVGKG
jgi:hypothetical protein